jgi:putative IMPACT (imprinted ancient) family translation regulator
VKWGKYEGEGWGDGVSRQVTPRRWFGSTTLGVAALLRAFEGDLAAELAEHEADEAEYAASSASARAAHEADVQRRTEERAAQYMCAQRSLDASRDAHLYGRAR